MYTKVYNNTHKICQNTQTHTHVFIFSLIYDNIYYHTKTFTFREITHHRK